MHIPRGGTDLIGNGSSNDGAANPHSPIDAVRRSETNSTIGSYDVKKNQSILIPVDEIKSSAVRQKMLPAGKAGH